MAARILLIEDDAALGAQTAQHLRRAGFDVTWLRDGDGEIDLASFDLLVLDLMLPGTFGLDLLKRFRETSDVPVLILSARADGATRVQGLRLGADDYVTKPFWPEELVERVRARLRRPVLQREGAIEIGSISIDLHARVVRVDGARVALTAAEYGILAALAKRRGAPVTRLALAEQSLDAERDGAERTLDVHVSRIRKKLGDAGALLQTVWGIGYRLADPAKKEP
jgi:two-component system response regulator MtrA